MIVHPSERAVYRRFCGDDCLYRDHLGRRVVSDLYGEGVFSVQAAIPWRVEVDGTVGCDSDGSFSESLVVTAEAPGTVEVASRIGPPDQQCFEPVESAICVEGAGWVVESSRSVILDGQRPAHPPPRPGVALPFLWVAESAEPMKIARSDAILILADSFAMGDMDELAARQWAAQNISEVGTLSSLDDSLRSRTSSVASHLNVALWTSPIPPDNDGLVVVRMYDRFHGRQRARVLVDGAFAGWWYAPEQDRTLRWGRDWFGIDPALTRGKREIELAIDPPAGAPLWSVSSYEVWAVSAAAKQ